MTDEKAIEKMLYDQQQGWPLCPRCGERINDGQNLDKMLPRVVLIINQFVIEAQDLGTQKIGIALIINLDIHHHAICRRQTIHLDVDVLRIPGDAGIGLPAGDRDGERNECCPVCFQSVHFFQCSSGGRCDFGGSIAGLGCSAAELIQSCERIAQRSHLP